MARLTSLNRSQAFLLVTAVFFIPLFAVPLFVDPYWWAERFGWDTGPETDLGNYLGRCLGAVAIALTVTALIGARDPRRYRAVFTILAIAGALLAVVHLRGLIEDAQPLVEHLETAMYAGFGALAWWCRPPG